MSARDDYPSLRLNAVFNDEAARALREIDGLRDFALAIVSLERTADIDEVIAITPDDVLRVIDADMVPTPPTQGEPT